MFDTIAAIVMIAFSIIVVGHWIIYGEIQVEPKCPARFMNDDEEN